MGNEWNSSRFGKKDGEIVKDVGFGLGLWRNIMIWIKGRSASN